MFFVLSGYLLINLGVGIWIYGDGCIDRSTPRYPLMIGIGLKAAWLLAYSQGVLIPLSVPSGRFEGYLLNLRLTVDFSVNGAMMSAYTNNGDGKMEYKDECAEFKKAMMATAEDAFDKIIADRLPWLESDTQANVEHRTQEIIEKMLAGKFVVNDGFMAVSDRSGRFLVRVAVTNMQWDDFRRELIRLMPECPKDKEIESLKEQIKMLERSAW